MRRREFIMLFGGATGLRLPDARAQQPSTRAQQPSRPVIGFLGPASPIQYAQLVAAFRRGLNEVGYVDGQNVTIDFRWAEGKYDRLPAFAAELVQHQVTVIAGMSLPAALAAKAATTTIPIIFVDGGDPIDDGLVASVTRPTGNLTGVTVFNPTLGAKRLELLHELVPEATVFGVLANPSNPNGRRQTKDALEAAQAMGLRLRIVAASNDQELDRVFAGLGRRVDALMVAVDAFLNSRRERLIALSAAHRVPAIYYDRAFVADGGLISYGYSIADAYWEAGLYTAKILGGAKPTDLPVIQPPKLQVIINLKTAQSLGIAIPPPLRSRSEAIN
jgi:putative tryptophan/tyrosine transport system substrate-binding protein